MSLLYSDTAIAYLKLTSISIQLHKLKNFGQQCRCHSRSSKFFACHSTPCHAGQFFPIHSWVDLRHVCDTSPLLPFHFQDCQNYFCLRLISSALSLQKFLILGTFHPRRWPLASPC